MCTVLYNKNVGLLAKNRDKTTDTAEEIVVTSDFIAVKTKGASYFSLGINKFGVAFVSTAINSPAWTKAASVGNNSLADEIAKKEKTGLISPTQLASEMLPYSKSAKEIRNKIIDSKNGWVGYHLILVDSTSETVFELHGNNINERKLNETDAISNHFKYLKHGPMALEDYPSTFLRLDYSQNEIKKSKSLEDFYKILKYKPKEIDKQIWREGCFATVSSSIIDLRNICLYYSSSFAQGYEKIKIKGSL